MCFHHCPVKVGRYGWALGIAALMFTGSHQKCIGWSECYGSNYEWKASYRYLAGDLVFGVSGKQAFEESGCYDSGREEVTR
jgi:hypothetical protein